MPQISTRSVALFLLSASALFVHSGTAAAQVTAYAADQAGQPTSIDRVSLAIPVTARVAPSCASTALPNSIINLGNLDLTLPNTQVALTIQCNATFHVGLTSSNGGMKTAANAPPGYTGVRDYNIALHIKDNTDAENVSSTCLASSLTPAAGSTACSANLRGPATSTAPGFTISGPSTGRTSYLLISNAPKSQDILIGAADYSDTLTITLAAAS